MAALTPQTRPDTLEDLLARRGPLPTDEALALFHPLPAQVRALHDAGRLHGAIRPQNVLLDGRPRLTDPPVSVDLDADPATCPAELAGLGPVSSLSIEQAASTLKERGQATDPRRIDVYQLAALLVRLCTGKPVVQFLRSPLTAGSLPPAWRATIDRALAFAPGEGSADAGQLLADLEALDTQPPPSATAVWHGSADTPVEGAAGLPFDRLGHYRIVSLLGKGGMGEVYRGFDEGLNREVAIKVLRPSLARTPSLLQRFQNEASTLARIDHPNLVPIHFIGQDHGVHFFAMQYIQGESLEQRLTSRRKLSSDETLAILEGCLSGLGAAHQARLVHRDIKPGNILLEERSNRVRVADFGLVKDLEASRALTSTGTSMGTVSYMAPEQARGEPVDGRADLYSLGVVVYRMLSGRLPFEADSLPAMLFQHAYTEAPPLTEVSLDLARIVEGMLCRRPAGRYSSCDEVLADLGRLRRGEPVVGPSPAPALQLVRLPELDRLPDAPPLPSRPMWGIRLGAWLGLLESRESEALGTTTQQVDGLVERYQHRREELAGLVAQAEELAGDLATQAAGFRLAAEAATRRAADLTDEPAQRLAGEQRQRAEDQAVALEGEASQQRGLLESLRQELAQVEQRQATLVRQRGVLAQRQQRLRPVVKSRPVRVRLAVCASLLAFVAIGILMLVLWLRGTPGEEDYQLGLAALDAPAHRIVGGVHLAGEEESAFESFEKARKSGHLLATAHVALGYTLGRGVNQDVESGRAPAAKALPAVLAAAPKDAEAAYILGQFYQHGLAVEADLGKAEEWYRRAAEQDHVRSLVNLGIMYEHGLGVKKDDSEAASCYRKAAELNHTQAQNHLGGFYAQGRGVKKDEREATHLYLRAAKQGHPHAQFNLAWKYEFGRGVKQSDKESAKWYQASGEGGFSPGQVAIGDLHASGRGVKKSDSKAAFWYRKAADQNNPRGEYNLGLMYLEGRGVPKKDAQEAVRWLKRAAGRQHVEACFKLGQMSEQGIEVKKDEKEAAYWYRKAADLEHAQAQYLLGVLYDQGRGVEKTDKKAAVHWFRKAAGQGLPQAQYDLGTMLVRGLGGPKNEEEAARCFEQAAKQNHAEAQFHIGVMYQDGRGVKKDEKVAVDWFRKAALRGSPGGQYELGVMLERGSGVNKDEKEAAVWFRKAADKGHALASYRLGMMCKEGRGVAKNEKEAFRLLHLAADRNHVEAQFQLANLYVVGLGVPKNDQEALNWYRKAAEGNHAQAQYYLAQRYHTGLAGLPKSEKDAAHWYGRAARQNHPWATLLLAGMYERGGEVEKDEKEAARLYKQAAGLNFPLASAALIKLGAMYAEGRGVPKDEKEAVRLYRVTADKNYPPGQTRLGEMYAQGLGVEKNEKEAVALYRKAAERKYPQAQTNLGLMYLDGRGVEKDEKEAVRWFRLAADGNNPRSRNDPQAQNNLGLMYKEGRGVPKDDKEAVRWFRLAAERTFPPAQNNLGLMYEQGIGVEKDEKEAVRWFRLAADQNFPPALDNLSRLKVAKPGK